jgi:hypothetical protein
MAARKKNSGGSTMLAIVAGLYIAGQVHHPAKGLDGARAVVADAIGAATLSTGYGMASWARAFLRADGKRATACNVSFMEGWQRTEGTYGRFRNPLDTTEQMPGSWSVNSVGVQEYPSLSEGIRASVITIRNGRYGGIESALAAGDSAQAAASAVGDSPWGTPWFSAAC